MKILFIAPRFHSNQSDLVKKLRLEGHDVQFWVMGKSQSEDYSLVSPTEIPESIFNKFNFINHRYKKRDFAKWATTKIPSIRKIISYLNNFQPEVVIIRGATNPIYSKILLPILLLKRIKIVFYTQGAAYVKKINPIKNAYLTIIKQLKIKWFTTVLYKNNKKETLIKVPNLVFIPFFIYSKAKEAKKVNGAVKFLCIGKYQSNKNIKLLLEVINKIHREGLDFKITIIGSTGLESRESYFNEVKNYIENNGLREKVEILKNLDFSEIPKFYQTHHVFVLPSVREPASISQIEAMSYGLPVICSNDNGTAHYVKNQENGCVIEMNFQNLYNAIVQYINDSEMIRIHSKKSLKIINDELNIDNNYHCFIELIKS